MITERCTLKLAHLALEFFHTADLDFVGYATKRLADLDALSVIGSNHANLTVSCCVVRSNGVQFVRSLTNSDLSIISEELYVFADLSDLINVEKRR